MASSLVSQLAADCAVAAELAVLADIRRGRVLDHATLAALPLGARDRVIRDFERRGWLIRAEDHWLVPENRMPKAVPAFLAGMAAMRGPAAAEEASLTAVTLPTPPSAIAGALPTTGLSYASLITTDEAMLRVAVSACTRLTVISPFLNGGGLAFALQLFESTGAHRKVFVVRGTRATRAVMRTEQPRLEVLRVVVRNCLLTSAEGYETVHAKVVLADEQLAYVGSANLLVQRVHSLELGNVVRGQAARVVSSVVRAVEMASVPWRWDQ